MLNLAGAPKCESFLGGPVSQQLDVEDLLGAKPHESSWGSKDSGYWSQDLQTTQNTACRRWQ